MQSCSESPLDSAPSTSSCSQCQAKTNFAENVVRLLAWRQISPTVKRPAKRLWGDAAALSVRCHGHLHEVTNAKQTLVSWVEAESFKHSVARYCPLVPPPRSTIAAAFSPDGKTLASTHGDHTVKIICCHSGQCLKVLSGHRRTPWVVRYHPSSPEMLASGSLDYEVRLWNANTAECVGSRDFYRLHLWHFMLKEIFSLSLLGISSTFGDIPKMEMLLRQLLCLELDDHCAQCIFPCSTKQLRLRSTRNFRLHGTSLEVVRVLYQLVGYCQSKRVAPIELGTRNSLFLMSNLVTCKRSKSSKNNLTNALVPELIFTPSQTSVHFNRTSQNKLRTKATLLASASVR